MILNKNFQPWYLLGRTSRRYLWCWLSFHFWFSFRGCSSFIDVLHSPYPFVNYRQVFTPILYFPPSPSQSDSRHFDFQPFRFLLTASATVLSGLFYPQAFFTLHSFLTFLAQLAIIKASLGAGSSSSKFAGLHSDSRNTDLAHLFV